MTALQHSSEPNSACLGLVLLASGSSLAPSYRDGRLLSAAVGCDGCLTPLLSAGATSGFVAAPKDGASCPAVCSSVDQNPAGLQQFNAAAPIESYSCAANVSGQGLVPGYQLTSNTTCTVAWGRSVDLYNDFSCLCVEPSASLGIVNAESGACSWACNQTVDGLVGSAAQAEASTPSDACIPAEDIGAPWLLARLAWAQLSDLVSPSNRCCSARQPKLACPAALQLPAPAEHLLLLPACPRLFSQPAAQLITSPVLLQGS